MTDEMCFLGKFGFLTACVQEASLAGKRLEQIVAALTLTAWTAWLVAFGLLYGLHSELGDASGRALPAEAMNEVRYLHTWILVLQITAEVLSGAAFKLLWSRIHWQNTKVEVVPSPDLAFMQKESDRFYEAESRTADFVGRIDDYHANYRNGLAAFTVACEAELRRLKNGARAAEAAARAEFLAAGHAPAASRETEEIEA